MLGLQIAITPPHPPPRLEEQLASTALEVLLRQRSGPLLVKSLCWAIGLLEVTVIAASYLPNWPFARNIISVLVLNGKVDRIYASPLFILGISLTILGASIRHRCYRELGTLFTFEMCIRQNHKLVQTGPYHMVRHPGYTGVLLTVGGLFCSNACPGSWLRECGALETTLGLFVVVLGGVLMTVIAAGLLVRISKEDAALQKQFGEDWVLWSMEVRYKLVPGLF
ncbi:hypothetical protein B0H15DRAFT_924746 [Mycena belliarum]|uniref:Protein-S-isoprenylcysteine O-methyltransferase n=1 Tax=Mycena belliarum TaxID=1033014 RepID=A0AAD6XL86_9AGAR|nr:hypothetical protein B0H15DRAFT_924746 [Mycena belliae]